MSKILKNIIHSVLVGSIATLAQSDDLEGYNEIQNNYASDMFDLSNELSNGKSVTHDKNLVLKKTLYNDELMFASHRSHRSHSSHRSHYSSSPSPSPPAPTPRPSSTAPVTTSQNGQLKLGDRVLELNMVGGDVNELMIILVKHKYLDIQFMNSNSTFTEELRDALIKFQSANNLTPNGRTTPATVIKLKALD